MNNFNQSVLAVFYTNDNNPVPEANVPKESGLNDWILEELIYLI